MKPDTPLDSLIILNQLKVLNSRKQHSLEEINTCFISIE